MKFPIDFSFQFVAIPFIALALRYVLFAGGFYLVFYIWKNRQWQHRKIQPRFPTREKIMAEILYSVSSLLIFGAIGVGIILGKSYGILKLYPDPLHFGIGYLVLSFFILVFAHDTWFYWTHRLMHYPKLFRWVHATHHRSTNPSPWAAFAFHPFEAVIEASFLPIVLLIVPVNGLVMIVFLFFMITLNVIGHLGYEIFPKRWFSSSIGKWQNSSTHHNMHHQFCRHNFGLYFNFWDRWMGTNHPEYSKRLNEVLNSAKEPGNEEKPLPKIVWDGQFKQADLF